MDTTTEQSTVSGIYSSSERPRAAFVISPSVITGRWQGAAVAALAEIGALPVDAVHWKSRRPSQAARLGAWRFLEATLDESRLEGAPTPFIVATPARGVVFEWVDGNREFHLGVSSDGELDTLVLVDRDPVGEEEHVSAADAMARLADWWAAR